MQAPSRIAFSNHAAERAQRYGVAYADIADMILEQHPAKERNRGSGDWILRHRSLVVVYNWPDEGDPATARVVTLWSEV